MKKGKSIYDIAVTVDVTLDTIVNNGPDEGIKVSYLRNIECRVCSSFRKSSSGIKHCKVCLDTQIENISHTATLTTPPPHIDNRGMTLYYKEHGHYSPETNSYGLLCASFNISKESGVLIEGKDIVKPLWITPFQAKIGGKIPIGGSFNGRPNIIVRPDQLSHGNRIRIKDMGGYQINDKERGHLYFAVNIKDDDQHAPSDDEIAAVKRIEELELLIENLQLNVSHLKTQNANLIDTVEESATSSEASWNAQGALKVIEDLLPSIDSLEKALENMCAPGDQAHREGVTMILDLQRKALAKHGVVPIPALGHKFNPHQHEAVAVSHDTGRAKNIVTDVLQEGYTHADRLLRPALVRVSG
ncbi:nucleotide exchange factor GrpE [Halomonas sp. KO116]|uniref:nucleotide exchange factor GrpE n=1 Tax=Halomonas sp. KO116 TaxID=1504981 RepID=UPI0004E3A13B|nr:nucleotide exchange factor GrpE [Halomonas sp. KO116]AJY53183.1 Protein grpE [Halomonas sp. KO116]